MNWIDREDSDYEQFAATFDPQRYDRQARRSRKPKVKHVPKKSPEDIVRELADVGALEGEKSFQTTYQPSRYEAGWLLESLHDFYRNEFITDVLAQVRGGKEASVYRCAARPVHGVDLLAAKVYRPRKFRQLRNDKMYREGRAVLTAGGEEIKENEQRVMRALGKKTAFGVQVEQTSWLMYEFTTLQTLHAAGAAVPKPFAVAENAILMGYIGDADTAAPTLNTVKLQPAEARRLFTKTLNNVELMLNHHMIHGDLSAYNILYWDGDITLIDFPQVTNSQGNSQAYFILERDVERICAYFAEQGVRSAEEPSHLTAQLWKQYVEGDPREKAADLSRLLEQSEEEV
ncbi:MAG: RIO1 family regulatory kinase/ATPase [Anaerolineae bacterium]